MSNPSGNPPCVACGSTKFQTVFTSYCFDNAREIFDLVRCTSCDLVRTNPFLSDEQLARYYTRDYYGSEIQKFNPVMERALEYFTQRRAEQLLKLLGDTNGQPPRVLDIGCGRGILLRKLHALGCDCTGTEIPEYSFPESERDIHFVNGHLAEIHFEAESFDAITIWNVLEHTSDPAATIREIARILKPGGVFAVAVPNFGSLQRRIFNAHWFHLDLPRHTHHFTSSSLNRMLEESGLQTLSVQTGAPEQELYGFVQSWQNASLSRRAPNRLYALLKSGKEKSWPKRFELLPLTAFAGLSLPLGVLQAAVASVCNEGTILTIFARKSR
jgi:2-polyprenyl-3-methyl-5-hydroxy-6-metoxy-1,4-benzoquinol methylase